MNYNKKEKEEYNIYRDFVCINLGITKNQYNMFRRFGISLQKLYTKQSNGGFLTQESFYRTTIPIEIKVEELANQLKLYVYFQTDPRGASIYLDTKPIPYRNYTQALVIY